MMNKVFFNTVKITLAAIIAILIARIANLEFYISAGIVTILTIQSTKKETIATAIERFFAFIIAIIIAYVSFSLFGFNILSFGIYLLFYIFICQYFKWYASIAVYLVLISHFLTFSHISLYSLINEILLFVIGVGIGIVANMHLHRNIDYMNALKLEADEQIKYILLRMSKRIINEIDEYDGNCFDKLNDLIVQAKAVSIENENNVVFNKNNFDKEYIRMREHQSQVLSDSKLMTNYRDDMYKTIKTMDTTPLTAKIISDFLRKISIEYHENNDCRDLIEEFNSIDLDMKSVPLPSNRKEFEDRARLFSLLRLIEEFLEIKKEFLQR